MAGANDAIVNEQFVDGSNDEYILQTIDIENVLAELNLSDDDNAITKSIILSIESQAAEAIKNHLITPLPNVGCVQRDPMRDILKLHNAELMEARKRLTKDEYKQYAKDLRKDIRSQLKSEYITRKKLERLKDGNKALYKRLVIKRGKAYADLYLAAMFKMKYVPFNRAVQEQYDKIYGRYED